MSSTLKVLELGNVGVEPRILFLNTDALEADVFAPGYINAVAASSGIQISKGDFVLIKYDEGTKQEMAIPEVGVDGVITLLPVAGDFNTGGPIDGGQNIGGGEEVFKDVVSNLMRFRTLIAGDNITLTENADDITIASADPGAGTITDGANLGTGVGVFAQASGVDLQFKSLVAGSNVVLTPGFNDITIDCTGSAGGTINDGVNLGTGNGIFESVSGADMQFKSLKSGDNVTIIPDSTSLTISFSGTGAGDITGGTNLGAGEHIFAQKVAPNLQFKTLEAGPNISLSSDSNTVTITGTSGGSYDFINTWFVAKGGSDLNSGTTISDPFLTFQAAVTAAQAAGEVSNIKNCIVCLDSGTYVGNITITKLGVSIYAPSATLQASVLHVSTTTIPTSALYGTSIEFLNFSSVTYADLSTNGNSGFDEIHIAAANAITSSFQLGVRKTNLVIPYFDTQSCSISSTNASTRIGLQIANTNNLTQSTNPLENLTMVSWANVYGVIGNVVLSAGQVINPISDDSDFDPIWANGFVNATPAGNITFQITTGFNAIVPRGWQTKVVRNGGTGNVQFDADGGITILSRPGNPETAGTGSVVVIKKLTDTVYSITGDVQNRSSESISVYVSKLFGSDVTGDGSYANPFASFGAAITSVGTPSAAVGIIGLDGETYTESLTVAHPLIYFSAPEAVLFNTGGPAALTVTTNGAQHFIQFGSIIGTIGSSAIANTGTSLLVVNAGVISGPVTTVNGNVNIRCASLVSDLTESGTGAIRYVSVFRSGANSGNIVGISPQGVTGSTTFGMGAYTVPLTDGTAGYVMTTDGAGAASWAAGGGGGGLAKVGIAGTTQAAAVDTIYINQNSGLTTITLPATFGVGDIVQVNGLGAGGWSVVANTGDTIRFFGVASSTGGSISSTNQDDSLQLVGVIANDTWSVAWSGGSGLTLS